MAEFSNGKQLKEKRNQIKLSPCKPSSAHVMLLTPPHLLLHWELATSRPPTSMSGKGEPLAKMARPPVAAWAWAAVHSDLRSPCVK